MPWSNSRYNARADSAGFTLIEIMIALAILGASLFILLEMHYSATRAQQRLEEEVRVRNLLAEAVGIAEVEIAVGTLRDSQEFGDRYPGWRYSFDAQPIDSGSSSRTSSTTVNSPYPGLHDVLVTVEDPDRTAHELHFYTVIPSSLEGAAGAPPGGEAPAGGGE